MYMVIYYVELHMTLIQYFDFKLAAAFQGTPAWFLELLLLMACVYVCVSTTPEAIDDYLYLDLSDDKPPLW